jgi:hypothetical protein
VSDSIVLAVEDGRIAAGVVQIVGLDLLVKATIQTDIVWLQLSPRSAHQSSNS